MRWIERQFSKGEINRAGRMLAETGVEPDIRAKAIAVLDNWRACHAYPLQIIKMTLLNRAKKIDKNALIAQRLKRRPSVEIKLRDNPNMSLSQMQDIGGCRAVLKTMKDVNRLIDHYKVYHAKSPKDRSSWDGSEDFDYIRKPKPDGYRSVHLIFRFHSPSEERKIFNGQRIEIQVRSNLQHVWATAVETAQIFTGQALKSKVKDASEQWLRFFALTSSAFALREKCHGVPGTPTNKQDLVYELRNIVENSNIMESLTSWSDTIHLLEDKETTDANAFLLVLDPTAQTLRVQPYTKEQMEEAQIAYETAEKNTESDQNTQVVLVSVDDLDSLRRAYPNYYVDTKDFVSAVQREIS
jgi:ppGpp synthetase/RelA/SpoT-type nucleotidyltranferase